MTDSVLFLGPPLDYVVMAVPLVQHYVQIELYGVRDFFDRHWLREPDTSVFALRDFRDLDEVVEAHRGVIEAIADANLRDVSTNDLISRLGAPYRTFADAQREVEEEYWVKNRRSLRQRR